MVQKEEKRDGQDVRDLVNISLSISDYNDIFSDFDSRAYSQKALSQDLLNELKRAVRELPSGQSQVSFIVPREKRNWEQEIIIKRRLREHFKKHYIEMLRNMKKLKLKGLKMVLLGVLFIFVSALLHSLNRPSFIFSFLQVLLEPAGWFTAWTGLDEIYYTGRKLKADLSFYEKMSNSDIQFISV